MRKRFAPQLSIDSKMLPIESSFIEGCPRVGKLCDVTKEWYQRAESTSAVFTDL